MKKRTNSLLIIDGENLLHRSYHKFLKFKSSDGIPTGAIYGFLKILHSNIYRFNPTNVIVTFDNGRSKHRLDILPEYKAGRKKLGMDYESLQTQKRVIMKILKRLGVPYIFDKGFKMNYEADDYIALLTEKFNGNITILSSDKDFHQLITERVKIMSPSKDTIITEKNCKDLTGYNPNQCVDYLSLVGDDSDNIPGYRGIGDKRAITFINEYSSISQFLKSSKECKGINKETLKGVWKDNRRLIDLYYFLGLHPIPIENIPIVYGSSPIDTFRLMGIFDKYSLDSFKTSIFIDEFKNLKKWTVTKDK